MAYKYRLVENEDEGNFIRPKADNYTIVLTVPEEKSEEVEAAFKNINNYGDYKSNFRQNPGSSEDYFGPRGSPNVKKSLENKFKEIQQQYDNEKDRRNEFINIFGKKQKNPGAKYDTLKSNNGKFFEKTNKATTDAFDATQKTSPLPKFEIEGNKLKFDNEGIIEKYIKTVMKNIGVDIKDYTISKKEELKKPTKESKLKEIIKSEIRSLLSEVEPPPIPGEITIEGISANGKGYTVWEGSKPIGDLRQKIGSYPKNDFGEISKNGKTYDFYYVVKNDPDNTNKFAPTLKDHVGRPAYFTVSALKGSVGENKLKETANNILNLNKDKKGIVNF